MRFSQPAFQLLALCQLAAASPCKPSSSGSSLVTTTTAMESSTTVSAESGSSTATLSDAETASESTTLVSTSGAEPTSTLEATKDITTLPDETTTNEISNTEPTTTVEATTTTVLEEPTTTFVSTTVEPTTTTAEASTTTTSFPQGPPSLIINGGFEDGTTSPWVRVRPQGTLDVTTSNVHSGNHAGHYTGRAPSSVPDTLGIKQDISASTLEAYKSYKLSLWYTLLQSDCFGPSLSCGAGWETFYPPTRLARGAGFSQVEVTCSWTQEQLNDGPFIKIEGSCFSLEMTIDDVVLEAIV